MKRFWGILLIAVLLLSFVGSAFAEDDFIGDMVVVHCDEWVSLRAMPNTSSERLEKVALGEVVSDCYRYSSEFIYVHYNGSAGYILSKYLQEYAAPAETETETEPSNYFVSIPSTDESEDSTVSNSSDSVVRIDETHFLRTERIYEDFSETLIVNVDDASGNTVWTTRLYQPNATELTSTEAFVNANGGTALVMLYNASEGLSAADALTGEILWTLPCETVDLGAGICYAIDGYGTMYIGGYYGPDPVAISREGAVLWQADSGRTDVYWLYEITLDETDGVIGTYDVIGSNS